MDKEAQEQMLSNLEIAVRHLAGLAYVPDDGKDGGLRFRMDWNKPISESNPEYRLSGWYEFGYSADAVVDEDKTAEAGHLCYRVLPGYVWRISGGGCRADRITDPEA